MRQLYPGAVLQELDQLVEPLKLACTAKVKANSVKQDELKRSAMRAVAALLNISGADKHPQLNEFTCSRAYRRTVGTAVMQVCFLFGSEVSPNFTFIILSPTSYIT